MDAILQTPFGSLAADLLHLFSLFAEAPIPKDVLKQLNLVEEEDLQVAVGHLTDYSLLEERGETYVLHGLLRKVIQTQMSQSHRRDYFNQGIEAFYDLLKGFNVKNPQACRHLDPYIPHFDAVVQSKEIWSVEMDHISLILTTLLNYYTAISREKALKYGNRLLKIQKGKLGDKHPDTVDTYFLLGGILCLLQRHEEALPYTRLVLDFNKENLGEGHPDTATSYYGFGCNLQYLRRHDEALWPHLRALKIRKKALGEEHLATAESYRVVGVTLRKLGRHEEALSYLQRALEIRQNRSLEAFVNPEDLWDIGDTLVDMDLHEEALPYLQRALNVRNQQPGEEDLDTADKYHFLGAVLATVGRHEKALSYLKRAREIRKEKLGGDHSTTADS